MNTAPHITASNVAAMIPVHFNDGRWSLVMSLYRASSHSRAGARVTNVVGSSRPYPSSGRWRLLVRGDSDEVAIERNGPVDGGSFVPHRPPVSVLSGAHDSVVAPDVRRFAVEKVHGLQVARMKDGDEEIAHRSDIL